MTASPPLAAIASVAAGDTPDSVVVRCLSFSFPFSPPVIHDLSLELPRGSRCLLTGANGAGKTSLLQVGMARWCLVCPSRCSMLASVSSFLYSRYRIASTHAAGAGRQVHGWAGHGSYSRAPRFPRHPAGEQGTGFSER